VAGGVEASGAQAKKQNERVVVARINTKRRRRRRWRRLRRWKTLNRGGGEGGGASCEIRAPALRVVIIINLSGV
jgi:hypothetical protein